MSLFYSYIGFFDNHYIKKHQGKYKYDGFKYLTMMEFLNNDGFLMLNFFSFVHSNIKDKKI